MIWNPRKSSINRYLKLFKYIESEEKMAQKMNEKQKSLIPNTRTV